MKFRTIVAALLSATAILIGPAAMASEPSPQPGPNDLTWAQLAALKTSAPPISKLSSTLDLRLAPGSCSVNTNNIYMRYSGAVYTYGAVGLKPLLKCTVTMPYISMSTTLYKETWWGLQAEVGPVVTSGSFVLQVQSKNIEKQCLSNDAYSTFYAITTSSMTFSNGSRVTGSVYQENSVPCVTF